MPIDQKIPEEQIRAALVELDQVLIKAVAATNAVDSVLGFLLNHRTDQVAGFTLLKESGAHYRHLAEFICPKTKAAIQELLPRHRKKRAVVTARRPAKLR